MHKLKAPIDYNWTACWLLLCPLVHLRCFVSIWTHMRVIQVCIFQWPMYVLHIFMFLITLICVYIYFFFRYISENTSHEENVLQNMSRMNNHYIFQLGCTLLRTRILTVSLGVFLFTCMSTLQWINSKHTYFIFYVLPWSPNFLWGFWTSGYVLTSISSWILHKALSWFSSTLVTSSILSSKELILYVRSFDSCPSYNVN